MPWHGLVLPIPTLTYSLLPGNRSSFRTDAAISNSRFGAERSLKAWVPDASYEIDGSLEKQGSGGAWDQFAENERLFGLKTDYDENIYTTAIDKSHPQYKERLAAAERKAREIERSVASTSHVAEERVMDFVGGDDQRDEEDKYATPHPPAGPTRTRNADADPLPGIAASADRISRRWQAGRTSTRLRPGALPPRIPPSRVLRSIPLSSRLSSRAPRARNCRPRSPSSRRPRPQLRNRPHLPLPTPSRAQARRPKQRRPRARPMPLRTPRRLMPKMQRLLGPRRPRPRLLLPRRRKPSLAQPPLLSATC